MAYGRAPPRQGLVEQCLPLGVGTSFPHAIEVRAERAAWRGAPHPVPSGWRWFRPGSSGRRMLFHGPASSDLVTHGVAEVRSNTHSRPHRSARPHRLKHDVSMTSRHGAVAPYLFTAHEPQRAAIPTPSDALISTDGPTDWSLERPEKD